MTPTRELERRVRQLEERQGARLRGALTRANQITIGQGGAAVEIVVQIDPNPEGANPAIRYSPGVGWEITDDRVTWSSLRPPLRNLLLVGGATAGIESRPGTVFQIQDDAGNIAVITDGDLLRNGKHMKVDSDYSLSAGGTEITILTEGTVQPHEELWFSTAYGYLVPVVSIPTSMPAPRSLYPRRMVAGLVYRRKPIAALVPRFRRSVRMVF